MAKVVLEEREFAALVARLDALESAAFQKEVKKENFTDLVGNFPFDHPYPVNEKEPTFVFSKRRNDDAWTAFMMLAKAYLRENHRFYMSETRTGSGVPYIRWNDSEKVRIIAKEPYEKRVLAAKMVSEMVEVFNKYFVEAHGEVIYKPSKEGSPIVVRTVR